VKLTVTLASPAATGGAVVSITYTSNGSLLIGAPSSLTVPAGSTTASATFSTSTVAANTDVIVSTTVNGSTKGGSRRSRFLQRPGWPLRPFGALLLYM